MFLVRVFHNLLLSGVDRSASLVDDPSRRFSLQTGDVQSTFGANYDNPPDYAAALELIGAGKIRVRETITHRLGLAETGLGFQLVARALDSLKVTIEPQM